MGYKWLGMGKLAWEEVKERSGKGTLAGCFRLYGNDTESQIDEPVDWKEIEQHRSNGGDSGEELDRFMAWLPDGKEVEVPVVVDISELGYLDEQEYSLWNVIQEYMALFGIRTKDDEPDWATVKAVQDSLIAVLVDAGVNFKLSFGEKAETSKALEVENRQRFGMAFNVSVTDEDIDGIMVTALEGGITYWCDKATPVGKYPGEYASEQISRGGTLKLHDFEEGNWKELTKEKFMEGLKKYLRNPTASGICEFVDHEVRIDTCYVDAGVADAIIQYAVFGDIIYG